MIPLPLAVLLFAAQAEPSVSPAAATAAPSAEPVATPVSSTTPEPAPTPTATPPGPAPSATPDLYGYRFVPRQPDHPAADEPQIFAVYLNAKKLKSLGPIDIKVATSPNVVKVLTRSNGREGTVPRLAPGDFEAESKLPKLPVIASGITTTLDFIAVSADGRRVTVAVPVTLE